MANIADMSDDELRRALSSPRPIASMSDDELRSVLSSAPDKYKLAALQDVEYDKKSGIYQEPRYTERMLHGATLGASDEIMAGAATPIEMFRKGTWDPREGYKYAKAAQDLRLEEARKNQGATGMVAEMGGGLLSGTALAKGGLTAARYLASNAGLVPRAAASAADAAGFGTVAGAMEGNSLSERAGNAGVGAGVGLALGAAAPVAGAVVSGLARPITNFAQSRMNPERFVQGRLAGELEANNIAPQRVASDVSRAAQEGQGAYTVADAMGNPGQRMLAGASRQPGPGRTETVEFVDQRQAGQGRRVAQALEEGFGAPETAAQTHAGLKTARGAAADVDYGRARAVGGAVDVTPAIARIDAELQPGVTGLLRPQTNIADNSVESVLRRARAQLTDGRSQVSDFNAAFMAKREIQNIIDGATPTQQRALIPVLKELDKQLETASALYAAARDRFREATRVMDAVDTGTRASQRGRIEDTIPTFQNMTTAQQAAYRAGYVDPRIAEVQGAAFGTNKARPLTSDAFQAESGVMATDPGLLSRRIGRENTMFETRGGVRGGSMTDQNLADAGGQGVNTAIASALTGHPWQAARSLMAGVHNLGSGSTPDTRKEMARMLLTRGDAQPLARTLDDITSKNVNRRKQLQMLSRALMGAGAVSAY